MERSARVPQGLRSKRLFRAVAGAAILAAIAVVPDDARAFSARGLKWPNEAGQPVIYRLEPNGTKDVTDGSDLQAIRHAFATWQSVSCSKLSFMEGAWMDPKVVANDMVNRVYWIETMGQWPAQQAATI